MNKYYLLCLLIPSLLFLPGCQKESPEPWIPVLEQTDFAYLDNAIAEVRLGVENLLKQLNSGESAARTNVELEKTSQALFKIERYFLPMTEVRQLIYDADRVYYLGRKDEAKQKLQQSKDLLARIGENDAEAVVKAVNEVIMKIEEAELAFDSEPLAVPEKIRRLGEKINLMVIKGDLVLAGAEFKRQK